MGSPSSRENMNNNSNNSSSYDKVQCQRYLDQMKVNLNYLDKTDWLFQKNTNEFT